MNHSSTLCNDASSILQAKIDRMGIVASRKLSSGDGALSKKIASSKGKATLISAKENVDSNIAKESNKECAKTKAAIFASKNRKSTFKSYYKKAVPIKPRKENKRISRSDVNAKTTKKDKDGKRHEKNYLMLTNEATKRSQRFRLYKDTEIGFDTELQDSVKENVHF
eukprot:TRINITY_DN11218_c0_g2_i3.p1 TRINITY_DN11218_c0_g2~~TRINITY_DN11218_c0_g2_i3.p1  ORF type:complete len:167 (-),score=8.06 TRINITY_DN11218_c0_g2_i3:259-759(-)